MVQIFGCQALSSGSHPLRYKEIFSLVIFIPFSNNSSIKMTRYTENEQELRSGGVAEWLEASVAFKTYRLESWWKPFA